MSTQLDALTSQVAANTSVTNSAIALLGGLKTALDAAISAAPNDDGAALKALSQSLGTQDAALAAAITANTPAAPASAIPSTPIPVTPGPGPATAAPPTTSP